MPEQEDFKIFVGTRTYEDELEGCIEALKQLKSKNIVEFCIVCDVRPVNVTKKINNKRLIIIVDNDPTSSTSLNKVVKRYYSVKKGERKYLLTYSKEVRMRDHDLQLLIEAMKGDEDLLVVGHRFTIANNMLKNELDNYYTNKNLIAYKIPWNTCALWRLDLFKELVGKFDEITARNPFHDVCVSIDGTCYSTPHSGMEDGLAIAKATNDKNVKTYFKLTNHKVIWDVNIKKAQSHREKLARKDTVMRDFMVLRDYSEEALLKGRR